MTHFPPALTGGFPWSLSDSKSPQISGTLRSILADFSSAVVWVVSILLIFSSSPNFFYMFLGIVQSALIAMGITVTFWFFNFSA